MSIYFFTQLAAEYKLSSTLFQPVEESLSRIRAFFWIEYLEGDIRVNNQAHISEINRPSCFFHEELAVSVRRAQDVALIVHSDGVDADVQFITLEEQDRNVFRL